MTMQRVITGPTGSGKSDLAEVLSKISGLEILNADPYQFYKEIPLLSNQPKIPSNPIHFLANHSILNPTNAGDFSRDVLPYFERPHLWVGMGLYLGAGLYGFDENHKKGTPFQGEPRQPFRMIVLNPERSYLYKHLDARIDQMVEEGALKEAQRVRDLLEAGYLKRENPVLKAIGLQHLLNYRQGRFSWEECLRVWKRDTRRLAKRQWTWLRKFCAPKPSILWIQDVERENSMIRSFLEI